MTFTALYGKYAAQPLLGFLDERQGVLGTAQLKINANWIASAALRYDLHANKIASTQFGISYIDDCLILGVIYNSSYSYNNGFATTKNDTVLLQLSLRTIGGTALGYTLNSDVLPTR